MISSNDPRYYRQEVVIVKGGGIPKWRGLLVILAVVGLLTQLPTSPAQAASFAGNSTNGCVTSPAVIAQFDVAGWGGGEVDFHLEIPHGGIVTGRWVLSNGYSFPGYSWGAGPADVFREWWVENRTFQVPAGTGGTAKFIVFKAADYGGCFTVDRVVVTQHPLVQGDPAPATTAQPSSTPGPTPPSGYDCNGSTDVNECDDPPAGWCWVGRFVEAGDPQLAECDDTPDAGTEGGILGEVCLNAGSGASSAGTVTAPSAGWYYWTRVRINVTWDGFSGWGFRASGPSGWAIATRGSGGVGVHTDETLHVGDASYPSASWGSEGTFGGWNTLDYADGPYLAVTSGQVIDVATSFPYAGYTGTVCYVFSGEDDPTEFEPTEGEELRPSPPPGYPSQPPNEGGQGGGPIDQCEGPDDVGLLMCQDGQGGPGSSFEHEDGSGDGTNEDGGVGEQQGSGVTECEGDNLTPVESKVGYIAPEPVPSVQPLDQRLTGFSVFTLSHAPTYIMGGIGWVGDMVGVIPASVRNTATGVYNGAVNLAVPGDCIGSIIETEFGMIMQEPPFSIWTDLSEAVEAGAAGGSGMGLPAIPLPGGETVALPVDDIAPAMDGVRPFLVAGIWLMAALSIIRIVVGSFHVGKGGSE